MTQGFQQNLLGEVDTYHVRSCPQLMLRPDLIPPDIMNFGANLFFEVTHMTRSTYNLSSGSLEFIMRSVFE